MTIVLGLIIVPLTFLYWNEVVLHTLLVTS